MPRLHRHTLLPLRAMIVVARPFAPIAPRLSAGACCLREIEARP
jgi:hypothetical protein